VAHWPSLRRPFLIARTACIALLLAALLSAGAGGAGTSRCRPGPTTIGGKKADRFCGPATVAIHAGKYWFRLRGGSCAATTTFFTVNVGTAVVAPNQRWPYFGLTVGQYPNAPPTRKPAGKDGVYHLGVIVIRWHGGAWDVSGYMRITLWGNRTGGKFAGATASYPHRSIYGTFSCG